VTTDLGCGNAIKNFGLRKKAFSGQNFSYEVFQKVIKFLMIVRDRNFITYDSAESFDDGAIFFAGFYSG